jgi:uncharacterized protein YacL
VFNYIKTLKEKLLDSPVSQVVLDTIITLAFGILSGTFVTEITVGGKISWKNAPHAISTYLLIFLLILYILYKRLMLGREQEIMAFQNDDFCRAYARSQMLPEMAKRARERIRNGSGGELLDAMKEIEKVLK